MEIKSSHTSFGCSHGKPHITTNFAVTVTSPWLTEAITADPSVDCYVSDMLIKKETPFSWTKWLTFSNERESSSKKTIKTIPKFAVELSAANSCILMRFRFKLTSVMLSQKNDKNILFILVIRQMKPSLHHRADLNSSYEQEKHDQNSKTLQILFRKGVWKQKWHKIIKAEALSKLRCLIQSVSSEFLS